MGLAAVAVVGCSASDVTPYPAAGGSVAGVTATPSVTPSASATPSPTATATDTPSDTATDTPTPSPTKVATPKPTPTPLPPLAIGLCTGAQLKLTINDWESDNTGDPSYPHLTATNVSSVKCNMRGTPRVQILDSHGNLIADAGTAGGEVKSTDPVYTLSPGGTVNTITTWSNYCKSTPSQPYAAAVVLPFGLGRIAAKTYTAKTTYPAGCYASGSPTTVASEKWAP